MSHLKRTLILIIVIFAVALSSCQSAKGSFRVYKEGDDWYFEHDIEIGKDHCQSYPPFSSLDHLYQVLIHEQRLEGAYLSAFCWLFDSHMTRQPRFKTIKLDRLYNVSLPLEDLDVEAYDYHVIWTGDMYLHEYENKTEEKKIMLYPPEQEYDLNYANDDERYVSVNWWMYYRDYLGASTWDVDSVMLSVQLIDYRNATEYIYQHHSDGGFFKDVKYTICKDNKSVHVIEPYWKHEETDAWKRNGGISFFIEENGQLYNGVLLGFDECPPEEWFLSIELEPFVPEDAA